MAKQRKDDADAFIRDPDGGPIHTSGSVDEEMTEEFMLAATSGEDASEDVRNQTLAEEYGGPFVTTTADQELAEGTDESNPDDAMVEAEPSPMRGRT